MKEKYPERKVGIVTFTDFIETIGDGTANSVVVRGDQLNDYDFLLKNAVVGASTSLSKSISNTYSKLT